MGRRAVSFITYNPYEDQRIDPKSNAHIFIGPELPNHIHDAVARAKKLVGNMGLKQLKEIAKQLDVMAAASIYCINELDNTEKDYVPADESDNLKAYLKYADHDYPDSDWPMLFGVLALSLAGEIVNTLWPSKEYLAAIGGEISLIQAVNSEYNPEELTKENRRHIQEFAVEAVRAAGFGEGILLANKYHQEKAENAKGSPLEILYDIFNEWATSLPDNHGFSSTEEAVNIGLKQYLVDQARSEKPDIKEAQSLSKKIGKTTHRRLKEKLETYCEENEKDYPFPRLRSKNKTS